MSSMPANPRWEFVRDLGTGGQGVLYHVKRKRMEAVSNLQNAMWILAGQQTVKQDLRHVQVERLTTSLAEILDGEKPSNQGALKILHSKEDARDPELAAERIRREIEALEALVHPHIAEIIDSDLKELWFVSKYYEKEGLDKNSDRFSGNVVESIVALRPVVEAAAYMHARNIVHRDIKPNNIFVGASGELILGDFGLVFMLDDEGRISRADENVGSRYWQPPWAEGIRLKEVRPSFDVFSLAKVLWYMISGKPVLPFWYYYKDDFNVEYIHPDAKHISLVNGLLSRCLVEEEDQCLSDAGALLEEIDHVIWMIQQDLGSLDLAEGGPCIVCGIGHYRPHITWDTPSSKVQDFGLHPRSEREFRVHLCDNCGHVQFFSSFRQDLPGWQ